LELSKEFWIFGFTLYVHKGQDYLLQLLFLRTGISLRLERESGGRVTDS
jgi:energy-converting hydrogenase Eha subunit G